MMSSFDEIAEAIEELPNYGMENGHGIVEECTVVERIIYAAGEIKELRAKLATERARKGRV